MDYASTMFTCSTGTYQPPRDRCELCQFYRMIDSGYGWCFRNPPQNILVRLIPLRFQALWPEVAWDSVACGEYLRVVGQR